MNNSAVYARNLLYKCGVSCLIGPKSKWKQLLNMCNSVQTVTDELSVRQRGDGRRTRDAAHRGVNRSHVKLPILVLVKKFYSGGVKGSQWQQGTRLWQEMVEMTAGRLKRFASCLWRDPTAQAHPWMHSSCTLTRESSALCFAFMVQNLSLGRYPFQKRTTLYII